jgi:hypothetical protein
MLLLPTRRQTANQPTSVRLANLTVDFSINPAVNDSFFAAALSPSSIEKRTSCGKVHHVDNVEINFIHECAIEESLISTCTALYFTPSTPSDETIAVGATLRGALMGVTRIER